MPSRKGMTELEMKDIIKFLLSNGWVQKNGENNPYLLFRFQLENNIVKFYQSKRGITFFCNTQVMMKQIIDRNIFKDTDFKGILEIDDAGIGSLIGGVLIGFHVPYVLENCRHSIVEVKYFQSPLFEQGTYRNRATELILEFLKKHDIDKKTFLLKICTGTIFDHTRTELSGMGYCVTTAQVKGRLQEYIEKEFQNYLKEKCSLPDTINGSIPKTKEMYRISFGRLKNFIKEHPNYLKFCKTGWNFFKEQFKL